MANARTTATRASRRDPTLAAVAERAGVSIMTVSRVLRGVGMVSPETRDRVQAAAEALDLPHLRGVVFGPAVRRGRSDHALRLVRPVHASQSGTSWFREQLTAGIRAGVEEAGGAFEELPFTDPESLLTGLAARRPHGVVLYDALPLSMIRSLQQVAPVVQASFFDVVPGIDCVYTSELRGAALALDRLVGLGHRSIVWLGVIDRHAGGRLPAAWFDDAALGDRWATGGLTLRFAAWTAATSLCPDGRIHHRHLLCERDWRTQTLDEVIDRALDAVLADAVPATAVVAMNDLIAIAIRDACSRRGVRIPEDLSLIGYGGTPEAFAADLATVVQPQRELGQVVPELIQRRRARPTAAPLSLQLEPGFHAGITTDIPRNQPC